MDNQAARTEETRQTANASGTNLAALVKVLHAAHPSIDRFHLELIEDNFDQDPEVERFMLTNAYDTEGNLLDHETVATINRDLISKYDAMDFVSALYQWHTVTEALAFQPTPEAAEAPAGPAPEAKETLTLQFTITQHVRYTGEVTVDAKDIKAWMVSRDVPELNAADLREYLTERDIEHKQFNRDKNPDEDWSALEDTEGTSDIRIDEN